MAALAVEEASETRFTDTVSADTGYRTPPCRVPAGPRPAIGEITAGTTRGDVMFGMTVLTAYGSVLWLAAGAAVIAETALAVARWMLLRVRH